MLGLLPVIFCTFVPELWMALHFTPKFCFRSISLEQNDRISPNFVYEFVLTRSKLGLLPVIFRTFVQELCPLIYARIPFPLNILRTKGHTLTKLYIIIYIDKI